MDFNDIQNAWNNEKTENVVVPNNLEKIQSASMPLDRIRKSLRMEFFIQILSLVIIGLLPVHSKFPSNLVVPYYFIFGILVAIYIYYLTQLFLFYRRLDKVALKTKDSLYETYLDIRLNMQLYKTFTFSLSPFFLIYFFGFILYEMPDFTQILNEGFANRKLGLIVLVFVLTILMIGVFTEWWVHHYYGKYAKEIRKVIDELKEE
ncbi:DUF485 domain-containing protein [Flavobacterium collinsii]|uniref:DUF3278 domain-containing protein n=1 Tax=Flavobacterium collinsii TaxID=1114861 RepID=A0ABM8KFW1_9FLAO|nr:hypothetical protein [Flavobacterium collinsii]CAA9196440.1 hypothetical protein FLACOL7796_01171 [Flavobacterium collinsii]